MWTHEQLLPSHKVRSGEFVIGVGDTGAELGAHDAQLGTVRVSRCSPGPTTLLLDSEGRSIGLFIGHVIDYRSGCLLSESVTIADPPVAGTVDRVRQVEDFVYGFGGRWLLVYVEGSVKRVYLDADGSNSVVYDSQQRRAASTTGLLLDDQEYVARFDHEVYERLDVEHDGWFPSGLTAHSGVRRLLCNHALDLDTWKPVRHWPRKDFTWTSDVRGHAERIAAIVRDTLGVLVSNGRVAMTLTAGNETRLLLAAARPFIDEIDFVTMRAPGAGIDVHHAGVLAGRFGLRHRFLDPVSSTPDQMRDWSYRTGHTVGGHNMRQHASIEPLAEYDFFVGGLGGEIGRGFFWRPGDGSTTTVDAPSICARFGMPTHPRVTEATEEWMSTVRDFDPLTQIDLAYLELRMSAWAFAQSYAQDSIVDHIHPMIGRETYQAMLELPPEAKRTNRFIIDGIEANWPELLDIPINQYGNYRDALELARKVASPTRVARRLRRMFG